MYMSSKNMSMVKGLGIGIAVGTVAAVASSKMMTRSGKKACRKSAAKCMKTVEGMLDGIAMLTK